MGELGQHSRVRSIQERPWGHDYLVVSGAAAAYVAVIQEPAGRNATLVEARSIWVGEGPLEFSEDEGLKVFDVHGRQVLSDDTPTDLRRRVSLEISPPETDQDALQGIVQYVGDCVMAKITQ